MTVSKLDAPRDESGRRRFLMGLAAGGVVGATTAWLPRRKRSQGNSTEEIKATPDANSTSSVAAELPLNHDRFMRLAIAQAREVPKLPFGAVLVDIHSGNVAAEGHNRSADSPTFHGEIDVINRLAAKQPDADWPALALYTTAEPCPMCQAAIEWAGISWVVYGSSIPFLQRLGWWQIDIRAEEVLRRTTFRKTKILGGVLEEECNALFLAVPKRVPRTDEESK
ncbi:MAG TPA: nucleoside deaminase [Pirellulales bacterium]|jgi:tRNA(Arg) A34 adenosine deaminase TadA